MSVTRHHCPSCQANRRRSRLGGLRSAERYEVTRLVDSFHCLPVTRDEAVRAGQFRRTFGRSHNAIGIGDYVIAATAGVGSHELATLNVKHLLVRCGADHAR